MSNPVDRNLPHRLQGVRRLAQGLGFAELVQGLVSADLNGGPALRAEVRAGRVTAAIERTVSNEPISLDATRSYRAAKALHSDGGNPAGAFGLLAAIVDDRIWERLTDNHGRHVRRVCGGCPAGRARHEYRRAAEVVGTAAPP